MAGRRKKTVTVDEGSSPILPESDDADTPVVTDDSASSVSQETSPPGSPNGTGVLAGPPVPASPPSEQPVTGGKGQSEKIPNERLIAEIRNIVCVPRVRGAIPSLVKYREGYLERYFFLDVDGELLRKAWSLYKVNAADPNPAAFTHLVINLLEAEFPRIYRAVTFVPLN